MYFSCFTVEHWPLETAPGNSLERRHASLEGTMAALDCANGSKALGRDKAVHEDVKFYYGEVWGRPPAQAELQLCQL